MANIVTQNHGPLVASSTYWGSQYEKAGKLFVSTNAGAIRILLPRGAEDVVKDMSSADYVILSRGPWREVGRDGAEFLFEDHTRHAFAFQVTAESFDALPGEPSAGKTWTMSVWTFKDGKPHKELEKKCYWRRAPGIPWLKPLSQTR